MRAISSRLIKMINLAPVVRMLDNTIHWINLYPVDNVLLSHIAIYPLDSVIHPLYNWALFCVCVFRILHRRICYSDRWSEWVQIKTAWKLLLGCQLEVYVELDRPPKGIINSWAGLFKAGFR